MARRENERCRDAYKWMTLNYGKHCLAPLTDTDTCAFEALVHAWDLRTYTRDNKSLEACLALLMCMQPSTRELGVALIPFAVDWSNEREFRREYSCEPYHSTVQRE
jgi:hypothetical protein